MAYYCSQTIPKPEQTYYGTKAIPWVYQQSFSRITTERFVFLPLLALVLFINFVKAMKT